MIGSTSKLRNVYGEVRKEKFEDVKPNDITTEGSLIDVNSHFIAVKILTFKCLGILGSKRRRKCCRIRC